MFLLRKFIFQCANEDLIRSARRCEVRPRPSSAAGLSGPGSPARPTLLQGMRERDSLLPPAGPGKVPPASGFDKFFLADAFKRNSEETKIAKTKIAKTKTWRKCIVLCEKLMFAENDALS